ncbi:unnamed protein product [Scytosiphon promiscuus]
MANQTIAPVLGITKSIDVMITSGAAGPLRLGGIEFVVVNGTSDLLLLGHSTMIERLGIDVEAIFIDSLQAAHGTEPEYDDPACLLTDSSPELMIPDDVELTDRIVKLQAGITMAEKAGLDGEALNIVKKAVFVDSVDCFRAGVRQDDPPADVPAMHVHLNPGSLPPHARPRRAAPEKAKFLKKFVNTLAEAGMVTTALGASFASPAMAVVKPSSVKCRLVIDYSVINVSTVPDPFPVPNLQSLGLLLANQRFFMSLDIFKGFWQIPLDVASQDVFTFVTPDGLWKPTRMPQGCRNATAHFQGIMHWTR